MRSSRTVCEAKCLAHSPSPVADVDMALRADLAQLGSCDVIPGLRVGIVDRGAGQPSTGRGTHAQSLMGPPLAVLVADHQSTGLTALSRRHSSPRGGVLLDK